MIFVLETAHPKYGACHLIPIRGRPVSAPCRRSAMRTLPAHPCACLQGPADVGEFAPAFKLCTLPIWHAAPPFRQTHITPRVTPPCRVGNRIAGRCRVAGCLGSDPDLRSRSSLPTPQPHPCACRPPGGGIMPPLKSWAELSLPDTPLHRQSAGGEAAQSAFCILPPPFPSGSFQLAA